MDYDATDIAVTYDRGRDHGPEFLDLWMNVVSSLVKDHRTKRILDLGCGTGRFSEALRTRFDALILHVCRDNVHPEIKNLRTMIATTIIGHGYFSCVVVHLPKAALRSSG